jgi:ankyrin repeat protein
LAYSISSPYQVTLLIYLCTPLHIIVTSPKGSKAEKKRCVEMLINAGADVDAKDENDWTPLHFAAGCGKINSLEVLLANGADVNARDNKQNTPLHIIGLSSIGSKVEQERCAEMLINAGTEVDAKGEDGRTPLHYAAFQGKFDWLEVLLANGADVNARTSQLNTPLHIIGLSSKGSKEEKDICAELLIKAGAVIDAKDEDGDTIFYYQFFQDFKVERPDLICEFF